MINSLLLTATPFLIAALGGLLSEAAGVLNIGIEGMMLIGAFTSYFFTHLTGSIVLGILLGMTATALFGGIMVFSVIKLKSNIFVAGLGMNLLAGALTTSISKAVFSTGGVIRFSTIPDPGTLSLPFGLWEGFSPFVVLGFLLVPLTRWFLQKTPFGLRLRSAGRSPESLRARGTEPDVYKALALFGSAALAGLGGAVLSLELGSFVPNISAGRGWIALVVVYLGYKNPWGIFAASLFFGGAMMASDAFQGLSDLPGEVLLALPYLITVTGMAVYSVIRKRAASR